MRLLRSGLLSAVVLVVLASFGEVAPAGATSSEEAPVVQEITTLLHPGLNEVGWVSEETASSALFDALPELIAVSAWDASERRARRALRGKYEELPTLKPGMGLWLRIGGSVSVEWTRPVTADGILLSLQRGSNLIAWTTSGEVANALSKFEGAVTGAWRWDPARRAYARYELDSSTAAGGLPQPQPGEALWVSASKTVHWWQPGTDRPELVFLDGVSEGKQDELIEDMEIIRAAYAEYFGVQTSAFTAYIGGSVEAIAPAYRQVTGRELPDVITRADPPETCGTVSSGAVFVLTYCAGIPSFTGKGATHILAHEYFHVLQQQLASDRGTEGPTWLLEGTALYAEHLASETFDPYSARQAASWGDGMLGNAIRRAATHWSEFPISLPDIETYSAFHTAEGIFGTYDHYQVALLGAKWLADRAGEQALADYYRLLPSVDHWHDAFESAFGISIADFYEAFATYPDELGPRNRVRGVVNGPDGGPLEGVRVTAHRLSLHGYRDYDARSFREAPIDVETWTDEHGAFEMWVRPGRYFFVVSRADPKPAIVDGALPDTHVSERECDLAIRTDRGLTGWSGPRESSDLYELVGTTNIWAAITIPSNVASFGRSFCAEP
ncbi:MAG: hypothetical protein F4X25_10120 [Chloroflexi bacterium]|nr:hypothetical protein [Chloroflexota bacterium]